MKRRHSIPEPISGTGGCYVGAAGLLREKEAKRAIMILAGGRLLLENEEKQEHGMERKVAATN